MNIAIIGAGLLGGSFGLALKKAQLKARIIVVEQTEELAKLAVELGIADVHMSFKMAMGKADAIVLATPVDIIARQLPKVLDQMREQAFVTDLGSTKKEICASVAEHPHRLRYVAAHPMAGTEFSGPRAAFANLFEGKICVICDKELSSPVALKKVEELFNIIGMQRLYMGSADHDRHLAYVSHLSHITSFALGVTVLNKEKDERTIFQMASTGFSSTVRLAKSSPQTWAPIFSQNRSNLLVALQSYISELKSVEKILSNDDRNGFIEWMERANEIRNVLAGIEGVSKK